MYIETIPNRNSKPCVLLRESSREGSKVLKKTISNLTNWPPAVVDKLRLILKGGTVIHDPKDSFEIVRSLPYGHVIAVVSAMKKLNLERIIDANHSRQRDLVTAMIAARIIDPQSKLATARSFHIQTCSNALAEEFNCKAVNEEELYDAMDWLLFRQESIEKILAKKHLFEGTLFYMISPQHILKGKSVL